VLRVSSSRVDNVATRRGFDRSSRRLLHTIVNCGLAPFSLSWHVIPSRVELASKNALACQDTITSTKYNTTGSTQYESGLYIDAVAHDVDQHYISALVVCIRCPVRT
jgi:hypothetical protein